MTETTQSLSFEQSLTELEHIVSQLEQGDIALDVALAQFERGIRLVRDSQQKLDQAQQKVAILTQADANAPLANYLSENE